MEEKIHSKPCKSLCESAQPDALLVEKELALQGLFNSNSDGGGDADYGVTVSFAEGIFQFRQELCRAG